MLIKVKGMQCNHCVKRVENALKIAGAKKIKIDLESGEVTFEKIEVKTAEEIILDLGYEIVK